MINISYIPCWYNIMDFRNTNNLTKFIIFIYFNWLYDYKVWNKIVTRCTIRSREYTESFDYIKNCDTLLIKMWRVLGLQVKSCIVAQITINGEFEIFVNVKYYASQHTYHNNGLTLKISIISLKCSILTPMNEHYFISFIGNW